MLNVAKQLKTRVSSPKKKGESPVLGIFIVALSLFSFVIFLSLIMIVVRFFIR